MPCPKPAPYPNAPLTSRARQPGTHVTRRPRNPQIRAADGSPRSRLHPTTNVSHRQGNLATRRDPVTRRLCTPTKQSRGRKSAVQASRSNRPSHVARRPELTSLEDPAPPQNRTANASERSTPWRQASGHTVHPTMGLSCRRGNFSRLMAARGSPKPPGHGPCSRRRDRPTPRFRSVGARHAVPKGHRFTAGRPCTPRSFLSALGRS